jgi:methylenetetrahydrofolate dehydrogenase (NADP+)/methenyltetrahydrofolate cyclohydrolase
MSDKIINGKKIADNIKENIKLKVEDLVKKNLRIPCLAVIIVGLDSASQVYVKNKEIACKKCGIKSIKYELTEETNEKELLDLILKLNNDEEIDGILVQLPLPKHINSKEIIKAILPQKDVDCFTKINVGSISVGDFDFEKSMLPCTPKGCIKLIKSVLGNDLSGKNVCIVGRSNIVGKPAFQLLLNENCTVKIVHSKTKNLAEETKWADILIVAIGKAKFIKKDMVRNGAVIIDVGMNKDENGNLCGDVDFEDVINIVNFITPVPGGVGPMTIACLMENVYYSYKISK